MTYTYHVKHYYLGCGFEPDTAFKTRLRALALLHCLLVRNKYGKKEVWKVRAS